MYGIENKKMEKGKLLAAFVVLAMVVCAFAATLPASVDADAVTDIQVYDNAEDTEPTITTLADAISNQKAGQIWVLSAGTYTVDANMTLSSENAPGITPSAYQPGWTFPIFVDNLTIRGVEGTIITTDDSEPNGAWATQNFITVFSNGVSIENLTIIGKETANKDIEVLGTGFSISNVTIGSNDRSAGGSLYFNGTVTDANVEGVTIYNSWISTASVTEGTTVTLNDVTIDNSTIDASRSVAPYGPISTNGAYNATNVDVILNNWTFEDEYSVASGVTMTINGDVQFTDLSIDGTVVNNGTVTVNGTATGTIDNENGTVVKGKDSNTDDLTINGGATRTENGDGTFTEFFPLMDEGTEYTYQNVDYTIYIFNYNGVDYQYGVHVDAIDYKPTITIEDLKMSWYAFPVDGEHVMAFTPNMQISWYDSNGGYNGELRDPVAGPNGGVILFSGSVYLNGSTVPTVFNKILDLYIQPMETTATAGINPWDIKNECNTPSFTYTYIDENNETIVVDDVANLPEGCTVTFYLTDTEDNIYEYPTDWTRDGLWFEEESKTFTLHAEFSSWNNGLYASCKATPVDVTLTNSSDLVSGLEFSAPADGTTYYKTPVDRFQGDVTVTNPEIVDGTYQYDVSIGAEVFYLESYPQFWVEPEADRPGYYVAFEYNSITGSFENGTLTIKNAAGETQTAVGAQIDGYFVLYLGNEVADNRITANYEITYNADSNVWYENTVYDITIDATVIEKQYSVILVDEGADGTVYNDEILLDNNGNMYMIKDRLRLPNGNGPVGTFLYWQTITGENFAHDTYFLIKDEYANAEGIIYLYAQYGDAPTGDIVTHTVTFVVDDSTRYEVTVIDGQPVAQPFAPYIEGMTFVGWNNGDVAYDFDASVTTDLELTAQFETIEEPTVSNVDIGLYLDEENYSYVTVFLSAFGEGMIPADVPSGIVTITYSYMIYNERFDMWTSSGYKTIEVPVSAGATSIVVPVESFENLDLVVSMEASFEYTGGFAETNYMTFSPELTTEVIA